MRKTGIPERVTKIRTDAGKSKTAFAAVLNISDSLVNLIENGKRQLTARTTADICEKFNVNREWLETGKGEPYNETIPTVMKLLKAEFKLDDIDIRIIEGYLELSPIERQVFKDYIKKLGNMD